MNESHRPRIFAPPSIATVGCAGYQPIDCWHFVIGGFRQHAGLPSGIQALWSKLRRAHGNGRVAVELREWSTDWDAVAELVWNFRRPPELPAVYVYAYSWGAGWGFTRLAHALERRGIQIEDAVLCDPVYRSPLRSLAWLSILPGRTVKVPANVARVHWFYQRQSFPSGHQPVAADPTKTRVGEPTLLNLDHVYMDDADEFHSLACDIARASAPPHAA